MAVEKPMCNKRKVYLLYVFLMYFCLPFSYANDVKFVRSDKRSRCFREDGIGVEPLHENDSGDQTDPWIRSPSH